MDSFKAVSSTLANVTKSKAADPVEKTDLLNVIDNNLIALRTVVSTLDASTGVLGLIKQQLADKDAAVLKGVYGLYVRSLSTLGKRYEAILVLKSFGEAAKLLIGDHEKLRDNFAKVFNDGTSVGEISLDQLKLSHAAMIGFLTLASEMADWFCFFYAAVIGQPTEVGREPGYRLKMLRETAAEVADFVNDTLSRGSSRDILSVVDSIRKTGDVGIYHKDAPLDSYAASRDYAGASHLFGAFAILQPILWVREYFTRRAHLKYKRNLAMRDWMITKTAVLRMDLAHVDPDSADYQHQLSILQKYSDLIANLDKQITNYEAS